MGAIDWGLVGSERVCMFGPTNVEDGIILRDVVQNEGGSGGALKENSICLAG